MRQSALTAALAGSLVLLPAAVGAQGWTRTYATDEVAADASYGLCPLFLAGQFQLSDNSMLAERGFGDKVTRTPNARFGEVVQVTRKANDGTVTFGGVSGKVCAVTITGANLDKIYLRLRKDKALTGIAFLPDSGQSGQKGAALIEAFKAQVEEQKLNLLLIRIKQPTPMIVVQLFGTAN